MSLLIVDSMINIIQINLLERLSRVPKGRENVIGFCMLSALIIMLDSLICASETKNSDFQKYNSEQE